MRRRLGRVYFGWWIVAGAVGIQILLVGLLVQAFGTYAAVWRHEFGWSQAALAVAYSLHRAESGLLGPLQGMLLQRFGARKVIRVGLLLFGTGLLALSRVETLPMFFATLLVTAVGGSLAGILSLMTVIVRWFDRSRSTALSLLNTGTSIGGLIVPVIAWGIDGFGWRSSVAVSGLVVLTTGLALSQVFRERPERPSDTHAESAPAHERRSDLRTRTIRAPSPRDATDATFTAREAMATRAFWLLSIGHALSVGVVSAILVHLVLFLQENRGYSLQTASYLFALMTVASIVGQLVGGRIGDRFEKRVLAAGASVGHAAALIVLVWVDGGAGVVVAVVLHGLAWGVRGPLMGALRADYFGTASFPTIMGYSSFIVMLGSTGGPIAIGVAADADAHRLGFTALAVLAGVGAGCFLAATRPDAPRAVRSSTPRR